MATCVEKNHPRGRKTDTLPAGQVLKYRGFRPFLLPLPQLARELRFWVQLPVPRYTDFSPTTSTGP
jgi:hypothetical protein